MWGVVGVCPTQRRRLGWGGMSVEKARKKDGLGTLTESCFHFIRASQPRFKYPANQQQALSAIDKLKTYPRPEANDESLRECELKDDSIRKRFRS